MVNIALKVELFDVMAAFMNFQFIFKLYIQYSKKDILC